MLKTIIQQLVSVATTTINFNHTGNDERTSYLFAHKFEPFAAKLSCFKLNALLMHCCHLVAEADPLVTWTGEKSTTRFHSSFIIKHEILWIQSL